MNVIKYDEVIDKVDKEHTWVYVKKKQIISREMIPKEYVGLGKVYNALGKFYEYYVIFTDDPPKDRTFTKTIVDDFGRVKVNVTSIWNTSNLKFIKKDTNINVFHVEHLDEGDIYKLDV